METLSNSVDMLALFLLVAAFAASPASAAIQTCSPSPCASHAITADFTFIVDVSNSLGSQGNFLQLQTFLASFAQGLTFSNEDAQLALYTYSLDTKPYLSLTQGSDPVAVQTAIQKITFDNTGNRNLYAALNREESEVTKNTGFRFGYKHVLVLISGDKWTGTTVLNSALLRQVQSKYDLVMAIGLGANSVNNQAADLVSFTGSASNVFFSLNYDQLPYAGQWLYNYACPGTHMTTAVPTTTILPTPNPSVPCALKTLNYDVYIIVDTSVAIRPADFAALKTALKSFVAPFPVGDGLTQFALAATSIDTELYYTGFHQGQTRTYVLNTLSTLTQDGSTGQTLKLSLQAIQNAYLNQNYNTSNKLVVYVTGTTSFDTDPNALMKQLSTQFGVKALAVQWTTGADASALASFTGSSNCVLAATDDNSRATFASWLQTAMCKKQFCL